MDELKRAIAEENESDSMTFEKAAQMIDATDVPVDSDFQGMLPCGLIDPETGQVYRDFEIIESNGFIEETVAGVARKSGGAKVLNKLLDLCVVRIGKFIKSEMKPKDWYHTVILRLSVPDQDYIAYKVRKISNDTEIESNHQCPICKAKIKHYFMIDELPEVPYKGDASQTVTFELPRGIKDKDGNVHKEIKMRMTNGLDREIALPAARINESKSMTLILARVCEFTDGYPLTEQTLRQMKTMDRKCLEKNLRELSDFGIKAEVEIECAKCGNVFDSHLSALDNFF